jgi:hypothetical protein
MTILENPLDVARLSVDQEEIVATLKDMQEMLECLAWAVDRS